MKIFSYLLTIFFWAQFIYAAFSLDGKQRRSLRAIAARMKNTKTHVSIPFDGLTPGSIKNIKESILKHEMVSVRFNSVDKKREAKSLAEIVAEACNCEVAQTVGHTALLYKQATPPQTVTRSLNEMMNEIKAASNLPG